MLSINDLTNGMYIRIDGIPHQVLEVKHLHMGRGGSSIQTRIKNIKTGQVLSRNFKPADVFADADIEKRKVLFLYAHRGNFVFAEKESPKNSVSHDATNDESTKQKADFQGKNRFSLTEEQIGKAKQWLKPNTDIEALYSGDELIGITVPIKMDFTVTEAPPALRGDTAKSGTKLITIETGVSISAPLFINEGDMIRVNTETGEYDERVEKK